MLGVEVKHGYAMVVLVFSNPLPPANGMLVATLPHGVLGVALPLQPHMALLCVSIACCPLLAPDCLLQNLLGGELVSLCRARMGWQLLP
jgi:hypothetical protein